MRYCRYDVDEENGGQYPGGEYEGKQDTSGKKKFASTASVCTRRSRRSGRHLATTYAARQGTVRLDAAVMVPLLQTQLSRRLRPDAAVTAPLVQTQLSRHHSSRRNCHGNVRTDTARQGTSRPDEECQRKWDPDEAYDGAHIGNRAVTVLAFRCDCQGTLHCSEDY